MVYSFGFLEISVNPFFYIGLPNKNSQTSFNKYIRVGYELNFYTLEGLKENWTIKPNSMTLVLQNITVNKKNIFELTLRQKLLILYQLLKEDDIFIIPLIRSIFRVPLGTNRWIKDIEFNIEFAKNALSFIKNGCGLGLIEERDVLQKNINFFERNVQLLISSHKATRGFVQIIEPRIHWLLDLSLIDDFSFFYKGIIKPGYFCNPLRKDITSEEEYQNQKMEVMEKYLEYQISKHLEEKQTRDLESIIDESISSFKKVYPTIIPLNAVLKLSFVKISASLGKITSQNEIIELIKNKYAILQDLYSGIDFIDAR